MSAPRPMTAFLARREHVRARRVDERRRPRLAGRRDAGGLPRGRRRADRRSWSRRPDAGSRRPAPRCCCRSGSGRRGSRPSGSGGWRRSTSLAMAEAARRSPGCRPGPSGSSGRTTSSSRPDRRPAVRKLAGVLGETDGLGTADPRVVVGIGVNADWAAADFPPDLAASMTSLSARRPGGAIDPGRPA